VSRTDYLDDPDAPPANSIVIAPSACVLDAAGRLLMIRRTDSGLHALPGGRHELGETMTQTAIRETAEETGLSISIIGLIGIYSNPAHVVAFSDGEIRQEFSICFRGRPDMGVLKTSDETSEARWVERTELADLQIHPSIRLRIEHGFSDRSEPYYT